MTNIPLDPYEDLIADELCAYQTLLDRGEIPVEASASNSAIPNELRPALDEFCRCLDLLDVTRRKTGNRTWDANENKGTTVYALPSHIGRFPILRRLGMGGFGIVFLGLDQETNRKVAIKVPRLEFLNNDEMIDRFRQEAASAARLDHPNILGVYESDSQAIPPYIVTPYIEGVNLAQWCTAWPMGVSPRIAAQIIHQLAEGVAHAHQKGILHRDLKPSNVLLAAREARNEPGELTFVPKLTDFGLAKCTDLASQHTRTSVVMGTASYMAPEQAQGRNKEITKATDVYGLGAILYELLIGRPPFRGDNDLQTIQQILRDEPRTLREHHAKIPVDLDVICLKCLDKVPANRYGSAQELANDLSRFLCGEPICARRISWLRRLGKWCRRHPARAASLGAAMLGLLTLLSVSLWYNSRLSEQLNVSERARETAQQERKNAEQQRQIAQQQALEMRRRAYVVDMRAAQVAWNRSNINQTLRLLERNRPREGEPDLRNFAWWHLWHEYQSSSRILGKTVGGPVPTAMTADGTLAASGGKDGVISLWSLPGGALQNELRSFELAQIHSLDFSPLGDQLVSANDDGTIHIWDVSSCRELLAWRGHLSWVAQAAYAPDGAVIASVGADHMVHLWNPQTGACMGTFSGHEKVVRCLAFHPSGRTLATGGRDDTIRLWDLTELRPDPRFNEGIIRLMPQELPRSLAFAPDGNCLLAATGQPGRIRKFRLSGEGIENEELRLPQFKQPYSLIWAHDGSVIVGCGDGSICFVDRTEDSGITKLGGHLSVNSSIAAPADRSCLVSSSIDGEVRYWPKLHDRSLISISGPVRAAAVDGSQAHSCQIQWSGQHLAVAYPEGDLSVFRMPERELQRTFPHTDGFSLSPSGELLLQCDLSGSTTCFRVADGRALWTLELPPANHGRDSQQSQAIDSSESYAAVACENELIVVPIARPVILHRLSHPTRVSQVKFVKGIQGPLAITTCYDGRIRFWDVQSGSLLKHIQIDRRVEALALAVSNDERFIAVGFGDAKAGIWRLDDLKPIAEIPCNTMIGRIAFLEGADIVALTEPERVVLWSVHEELELSAFESREPFAVSPDGKQLAVTSAHWIHLIDGRPTN